MPKAPISKAPPGSAWNYHDGNIIILSRLIRDAAGGHAADVLRFARSELFGPLGMRHVTLEFDAAGTPEGSSQMLASARDWARFGALYLNDGVVGGQAHPARRMGELLGDADRKRMGRIRRGVLDQSRRQFWREIPHLARLAGATPSTPAARFGQYVIIIPSERLVIARFGTSGNRYDIEGVSRLVTEVIAATGGKGHLAAGN